MKKFIYCLVGILLVLLFAYLILFRLNNKSVDKSFVSQIITPTAKSRNTTEQSATETSQAISPFSSVELAFGDVYISEIDIDLDIDGVNDKIIAFQRNSDNALYLVSALQNPMQKSYVLGEPVKLEITQTNNLSLYQLDLGLDTRPAIVCLGTTSDNTQVMVLFLLETISDSEPILTQVAVFHADVQIRITKNERAQVSGLGMYTVSCFETDISSPNTLTQIEKIYTWSPSERIFQKESERIIPGERVENQMLQRIGSGNISLFKDFLRGLWANNATLMTKEKKLMYYDDAQNEITFTDGELQEVYVVSSVTQRRYGLYFTTYNKSLTNIILRVDVEIKSLTEVNVHVVESVTRLKIGAESLWDGVYSKKDDSIANEIKASSTSEAETLLLEENCLWKNDLYELSIENDSFKFTTPYRTISGDYTLIPMQEKTVLQLRYGEKEEIFYEIEAKNGYLVLSEVKVKINTVQSLGLDSIVLSKIARQ